jgi:hypothetical protein
MKNKKSILLFLILGFYSVLYIATKRVLPCEADCQSVLTVQQNLRMNRSYVEGVFRCSYRLASDTLCVMVKDTIGVNWNLLADTACSIATQAGLLQQKIFIIKNWSSPIDTLARKVCP